MQAFGPSADQSKDNTEAGSKYLLAAQLQPRLLVPLVPLVVASQPDKFLKIQDLIPVALVPVGGSHRAVKARLLEGCRGSRTRPRSNDAGTI